MVPRTQHRGAVGARRLPTVAALTGSGTCVEGAAGLAAGGAREQRGCPAPIQSELAELAELAEVAAVIDESLRSVTFPGDMVTRPKQAIAPRPNFRGDLEAPAAISCIGTRGAKAPLQEDIP